MPLRVDVKRSWADRHPVLFGLGVITGSLYMHAYFPFIMMCFTAFVGYPLLWICASRKIRTWSELWVVLNQPLGGPLPQAKLLKRRLDS